MIQYFKGNLLESDAEVLVNTVNTMGIMGKGVALQFKKQFPYNYKVYANACKEQTFTIGQLLIVKDTSLLSGDKTIINFPTKRDWKKPSNYIFIEKGLQELVKFILENNIKSIAIPPLGAGNGGLDWNKVKILMEQYLSNLDCEITIYEPNKQIQEILNKEKVNLTPARAMLLAVFYDLVRNGEFVTEFAGEKIAYFLQRFGAQNSFKLDYTPNFYGPYSGKIRRVLNYLNGSYIYGYGAMDKKPFQEIGLIMDTESLILEYLNQPENRKYLQIVDKTKSFLSGFYSSFSLELLSTVDFIIQDKSIIDGTEIKDEIDNWSYRKSSLFTDHFIEISKKHLEDFNLLPN
ncbi:MAG: macro domain-containing protein [Flavobacteriaceae bacterium]|jgi:O-acetyl-ADP-ribose deacetylase (regulator of RNase III)|nr:macro domain-containing protein [Flavobacteriaceae bacterium]